MAPPRVKPSKFDSILQSVFDFGWKPVKKTGLSVDWNNDGRNDLIFHRFISVESQPIESRLPDGTKVIEKSFSTVFIFRPVLNLFPGKKGLQFFTEEAPCGHEQVQNPDGSKRKVDTWAFVQNNPHVRFFQSNRRVFFRVGDRVILEGAKYIIRGFQQAIDPTQVGSLYPAAKVILESATYVRRGYDDEVLCHRLVSIDALPRRKKEIKRTR